MHSFRAHVDDVIPHEDRVLAARIGSAWRLRLGSPLEGYLVSTARGQEHSVTACY